MRIVSYDVGAPAPVGTTDARRGAVRKLVLPLCILLLCACQPDTRLHDDNTVQTRDQAASVTISVSSVIPWSQISGVLQPNFALSSADALAQVAPLIAHSEFQTTAGTSVGVNASVQAAPGSATGAPGASPPASGADSQLPPLQTSPVQSGLDPVLKYQTARALYEAVQLMNREVQEAALRHCYVPYLVQLKLAVLPYRRHLPYDIHARLSFFRQPAARPQNPAPEPAPVKSSSSGPPQCSQNAWELPQVVPLLVTDDIERATASRAAQVAVQAELGAQYSGAGASGGAAAKRAVQSLASISAQDVNSRFTVSRQTYNTLYVRIGAAIEGTADFALVGQTYDIPVLLLVPRSTFDQSHGLDPSVQVIAYTEFRDARNGALLPDRPNLSAWNVAEQDVASILTRARNADGLQAWQQDTPEAKADRDALAVALLGAVQSSNSAGFVDALCKHRVFRGRDFDCRRTSGRAAVEAMAKSLWPQISALRSDSPFQGAFIQLLWPERVLIDDQDDATGLDDRNDLTVWLGGVAGTDSSGMTARLVIPGANGSGPYTLLATGMSFDGFAHTLSLKFPSPAKWGIATDHANLSLSWEPCSAEELCPPHQSGVKPIKVAILTSRASPATSP